MDVTLDYDQQVFQDVLNKTTELILNEYLNASQKKGFNVQSELEVQSWFDEPLPMEGTNVIALLDDVKTKVLDTATGNIGPNMYAYVMSGGNQVSAVAEFIMSVINQNNTKWHLAPSMTEIEKRVVKWTSEMVGFTLDAGGAMVSGGSEANLAGLTVARNIFFKKNNIQKNGLFNLPPFTLYCSQETHNCIDKSVSLLGIGSKHIRRIETNDDYTIHIPSLINQIEQDIKDGFTPFCIIGNAGTVNTGAIDDLKALADVSARYETWFHIDGAYGGLASALPEIKSLYAGIEKADSIALDFHKWLYQPFEIGCILVRDWKKLNETYYKPADYLESVQNDLSLRLEFNEHYFQLSRNAKAFKVWMSVKAYGFSKIIKMIQKDIALTQYLSKLITESDDFEIKSVSALAIVCFRYLGKPGTHHDISELNHKLIAALEKDGRVFITGTKLRNEFVIRACLINHRKQTQSVEYLLKVIREVGAELC
ncbi:MAG: pyridoxal-dependent decarboxylase [Saprospiraceae bacterium]|nr:pyridoxal-dependent decarboxylase [Saprospiraceae bacterium]MBK8668415.1 pyridoxal-dependent decarboxylase [Saprospiraceae bacterium]